MNKEIDIERKKNNKLTKENNNLNKELDELKAKIDGDNHPDVLKAKLTDTTAKLSVIKKENTKKSKEIELLVNKVDKDQTDLTQISDYLGSELNSMLTWVGSCLNCEYVFSIPYKEQKEKAEYKLPK